MQNKPVCRNNNCNNQRGFCPESDISRTSFLSQQQRHRFVPCTFPQTLMGACMYQISITPITYPGSSGALLNGTVHQTCSKTKKNKAPHLNLSPARQREIPRREMCPIQYTRLELPIFLQNWPRIKILFYVINF